MGALVSFVERAADPLAPIEALHWRPPARASKCSRPKPRISDGSLARCFFNVQFVIDELPARAIKNDPVLIAQHIRL